MKTLLAILVSAVCLAPAAQGQLFSDDFGTRTTLPPWVAQSGNWSVGGGVMKGGTNTAQTYGFAYIANNFTNFSAQAQFQFQAGAYGGGLGGRLNSGSGAHYAAWVYPENSFGGSNVLKLIRFDDYSSAVVLQQTNLAAVGTGSHTVKLEFSGSLINVYFDANKLLSATDATYPSGSISLDMWTYTNGYQMTVDNVAVNALPLVANSDSYSAVSGTPLTIAAPGVLGNDTGGNGPLSATLVTTTTHGTLTLNSDGSFTYNANTGFTGTDTFTYRASDGQSNSTATAAISVVTALYSDSFSRTTLSPWVAQSGNWAVTGNALRGGTNTLATYGVAYITNSWSNYSVQGSFQFPAGAFGGGVDACLNTATGARYSAWIYPEGSGGGALTLKLIKFTNWTSFSYNGVIGPMQSANLSSVGTSAHTLKLACATNQITVFLDGNPMINVTDIDAQPYTGGAIGVDFWTADAGYQVTVDDVLVVGTGASANQGLFENFDGVTAPALPAGWTTSATTSQFQWFTTNSPSDTAPNSAFCSDAATTNISELVSPAFVVTAGPPPLVFRNYCDLEPGNAAGEGYDGGVLEIKIGTGAFTDILDAGGSFATNGYNRTISTQWGNPLGGREAWSGHSTGFSNVIVNLPAAAVGQTVQLRWRCGTDGDNDNGGGTGWRIDSVAVKVNSAPVLTSPTDRTIVELTTLTVTNTATDSDVPADTLAYSLLAAPANATISTSGVITWTPTEAQGPSTNTFTTRVVDNGLPPLSATNSFAVVVNESNSPPVLTKQADRTIAPLSTLLVTNITTDPDIPANTFTYALVAGPTNAVINTNTGVITFTPTQAQKGTTNLFTTVVTDNNPWAVSAQHLTDTNSFKVVVSSGPQVVVDSTVLTAEGFFPTNNAIDPGEMVGVLFALKNVGGVNTTNLVVTLLQTNGVLSPSAAQTYGVLTAGGAAVSHLFTFTASGTCGGSITPTLQLQDGSANLGTATVTFALGPSGSVLTQNFDTVTAPALPTGWTTSNTVSQSQWYTTNSPNYTAPNSVFCPDTATTNVSDLVSTAFVVSSGTPQLSFRNYCDLEPGKTASEAYDGGVLEIKIGTGAFTDIVAAGGSFVTNGYNRTISALWGNPLGGRQAWSGHSTGFSNVVVNLPTAAVGQTVQLRWRCGTDGDNDNGGGGGWRIDSIASSGVVCSTNTTPVLPSQSNRTINELATLTVTNTASDLESPPEVLTYTLTVAPTNAAISTNGVITWTPTEAQGPGSYTFTTVVTDNASPSASTNNTFTVTVNEVNSAPVLTLPANQTINELVPWSANATAIDTDLPANILTFELVSGPSELNVNSSGLITWTPTEAQGPSVNTVTVRVYDNGVPSLSATNSFTLTVNEVNSAPALTLPANQTINELVPWSANATAIDTDLPANILTFELVSGPGGLTVSPSGLISWTPAEAQGPSANTVTVRVYDNGVPSLSDTNSFTLTVNEVNSAPVLTLPANQTINELVPWSANATAIDTDLPANILTFELVSGPSGLTVSPSGLISWTPSEAQGPSTNTVKVRVYDNGVPSLSDTNSFTLTVNEVNSAPVLTLPTNQTINELVPWSANATAIDTDLPPNILTFELVSGPGGLTVSPSGLISWTPTEAQGPSANTVTVRVYDNGVPSLSHTNSFTLTVNEVNSAPVLTLPANQTINELVPWSANATAIDTDLPPNILTFELVSGPGGLTVSPSGLISWTPTEAQGPSTNTVTVRVFDNGVPGLSDTNSFTLTVNEVNSAPVLTLPTNQTINELVPWSANATAIDTDLPPNILTFELVSGPTGLTVSSDGLISWTPTEAQGATTNTVTARVFDNGVPSLSNTNSFVLVVSPATNAAPPVIQSIAMSNGIVTITYSAIAGRKYRLQCQEGSPGTNWYDSLPDVQATESTATCTNATGTATQRFYRIYLMP